ncbi:MAG: molybdopterin-binding protein [Propionicimonas sp.]
MPNPTAAILIIGDEILSGRTRDTNAYHLALELAKVGIDLKEIRVVADDPVAIVTALNALRAGFTHVFTSGGIGPTHDDITADAVAAAFEVGIGIREDARAALLEASARRGIEPNEWQLRMARVPDGALLIENVLSGAPGFSVENVHVMAGVPSIFREMVAAVLPRLAQGTPRVVREVRFEIGEGRLAGPLGVLAADYPDLAMGSYPFAEEGVHGTSIVIKGHDATHVDEAVARLVAELSTH